MKTLPKLALGCLVTLLVLGVVLVVAFKSVVGFFSDFDFTTGPPTKAQSIPDGYQVEGDVVYYTRNSNFFGNWMPQRTVLEGADAKAFTALDTSYGKDATRVFYDGVAIAGVDVASFKLLGEYYSGDASAMYNHGRRIEGAKPMDAASFVLLPQGRRRAKDKNHVYADGYIVEGADPATFELLRNEGLVGRDKHDYYCVSFEGNDSPLHPLKVDMASFKILIPMEPPVPGENPWDNLWERIWASDNRQYIIGGKGYPIADPATFVVLQYGYAKDSKHVYFLDHVLAGADPATFQIVSPDHEKKYINWSWSFARYGKDAKQVFYKDQVVTGADAASFTVDNEREFKDKNARYNQGAKIE